MKHILPLLIITIFLSGCASQKLNNGLPHLTGKHIDEAIRYLGYPDGEQTVTFRHGDEKIYTWGHRNTFTSMQTVRTPFSGSSYSTGGGTYFQGHTTSVVPQTYNFQCTIKLAVNKAGYIYDWEWHGNEGGCERYAAGMKRLIADSEKSP